MSSNWSMDRMGRLGRLGRLAEAGAIALAAIAAAGPAQAQGWVEPWAVVGGPASGPTQIWGSYDQGCIAGAAALPLEGEGYQAVRPDRRRNYGHPELVDFVEDLARAAEAAGLGLVNVADLGQPRGGPIIGHASHESGLDVDIWFRLDLPALPRADRSAADETSFVAAGGASVDAQLWGDDQAELVHLAASDPRVARIFIHGAIKQDLCDRDWDDRAWLRVLIPEGNHISHMHVRLNCPEGGWGCQGQGAPPPGTGCRDDDDPADLGEDRLARYGTPGAPHPPGVLPLQCMNVFQAATAR